MMSDNKIITDNKNSSSASSRVTLNTYLFNAHAPKRTTHIPHLADFIALRPVEITSEIDTFLNIMNPSTNTTRLTQTLDLLTQSTKKKANKIYTFLPIFEKAIQLSQELPSVRPNTNDGRCLRNMKLEKHMVSWR